MISIRTEEGGERRQRWWGGGIHLYTHVWDSPAPPPHPTNLVGRIQRCAPVQQQYHHLYMATLRSQMQGRITVLMK